MAGNRGSNSQSLYRPEYRLGTHLQWGTAVNNTCSSLVSLVAAVLHRGDDQWRNQGMRPNILFIMTDQLRYDAISEREGMCKYTPNLDALTDCAVQFTNCVTTSPIC